MELIVKELTKLKDIIFGNGISDDKIIEAEQKLGVFFQKNIVLIYLNLAL